MAEVDEFAMEEAPENALDRKLAVPMFGVTLLYLALLAACIQSLRIYMTGGIGAAEPGHWPPGSQSFLILLLVVWPVFLIEAIAHSINKSPRHLTAYLYFLLPPLRLGARDHDDGTRIWLPFLGWRVCDRALKARIENALSIPMIFVALLILPILGADFLWQKQIAKYPFLEFLCSTGESIVWMAFTIEFIIIYSVVDKRLAYCIQHWIDLAVILMPLIAFLRLARLGVLFRVHQVTKMARVYRLRSLAMRLYRSILILNLIERILLRSPEKRLKKLLTLRDEKELELADINEEIDRVREAIQRKNELEDEKNNEEDEEKHEEKSTNEKNEVEGSSGENSSGENSSGEKQEPVQEQ